MPELEVQVRSTTQRTGVADDGDGLPLPHPVAYLLQQLGVVFIETQDAVVVLNANHIPVRAGEFGHEYDPVPHGLDGGVLGGQDVHATVFRDEVVTGTHLAVDGGYEVYLG